MTPTPIEREELQRLVRDEHAQLVEVLPPDEYEDEHLPGAINIPLKTLDAQTTRQLDPQRPVIVYCYDYQCDVSPRAAWRLETLGFPRVYDYAVGKADWGSYGLPLDGHAGSSTRVSSVTSTDVPTCRLDELVPDVAARLPDGWDICVVTNDADIVLGLLGRSALRSNERILAEDAMTAGPSTIRPSARLEEVTGRMHDQNLTRLIVTRSDGTLFGAARAEDIEPRHTGG